MVQELLGTGAPQPVAIAELAANFGIGALLAVAIVWHFRRFGTTLSNRDEFSKIFPIILLTTLLIITVVKSSLALSLGLVGALSIVRFRTPIKEPEELGYLFLVIAVGIGLGASYTLVTVIATPFILLMATLAMRDRVGSKARGIFLSVDLAASMEGKKRSDVLEEFNSMLGERVDGFDVRRVDARPDSVEITIYLPEAKTELLTTLIGDIENAFPEATVTYLDQSAMPGW